MSPSERIYALVPAIYRQRDAALGRPLEALCQVLDLEYTNLSADIAGLYAQWFIETCEDWVVPYIGDLVGTTGIETAVANVATQRARVANTLGYRSRRGVAATVANACADASGWAALPVEYFRRLVTSVNVGALGRVSSKPAGLGVATLALNSPADLQYLDGPFSTARRTVAVTAIDEPRVRVSGTTAEDYNLANLGVFLWRIPASPISDADPGHGPSRRYLTFHPLGVDTPLLRAPRGRTSPWVASGPDNVPLWISRALLETWTQMWRESRAPAAGLAAHELPELGFTIRVDGHPIPAHAIYVPEHADEDERQWPARVKEPQHAVFAVVDPERGRFVVGGREPSTPDGAGAKHRVTVDWAWGQAGSIGGGPYDREHSSVGEVEGAKVLLVSQRLGAHHDAIRVFRHLQDALDAVLTCREPTPGVEASEKTEVLIRILDSAAYTASELTLPRGVELTLEAAPGERPTLRANNDEVALRLQASGNARVVLSGLLVGGSLRVTGELDLELFDVTLWQATPRPALRWVSDGRSEPHLALTRCVTGPLCVSQAVTTHISESVVDGRGGLAFAGPDGGSGPRLRLDAVTALGDVRTRALEHAEDVLVRGVVRAETASLEIVRNADFVLELTTPYGEAKTRLVGARAAAVPAAPFVSERFGDPGYALLRLDAGDTVLRGGSGGAELGAYRALASGQRLANLTPALAEYLPWGVKAGIFVLGQRPSCGSGCHSPRRSKTSSRDLEP